MNRGRIQGPGGSRAGSPLPRRGRAWRLAGIVLLTALAGVRALAATPSISVGSNPAQISDNQTSTVFASVTVEDDDEDDVLTAVISYPSVRGTMSVGPGSPPLTLSGSPGNYTVSGTSSNLQAFLRRLVYTPAENRIPVSPASARLETTSFDLEVTDEDDNSDSAEVQLQVQSFNDPPVITVGTGNIFPDNQTSAVFADVTIRDPDVVQSAGTLSPQPVSLSAMLSETNAAAGLFAGGLMDFSAEGIARPTPASTSLEVQLRAVNFVPVPNRMPVGMTEAVRVTIEATDSLGEEHTVDYVFQVRSINDPPAFHVGLNPVSLRDTESVQPLTLSVTDVDPGERFEVSVVPVSDPTFQFGVFEPGVGPFIGTQTEIEAAVAGIRYRPTRDIATHQTVTFRLRLTDIHSPPADPTNGTPANSELLTLTIIGVNNPPEIAGAGGTLLRTTDDPSAPRLLPFRSVNISDPDPQELSVTLSVEGATPGTFHFTPDGGTETSGSPLTFSGPADVVSRLIRTVEFSAAPRPNRVVGQQDTIVLAILVSDGAGGSRSDRSTVVVVTAVNGAPVIAGIPPLADQPVRLDPATPGQPVRPFASPPDTNIAVGDDDGTYVTVTVQIDDPAKGHLENLGGFEDLGDGLYRFVGLTNDATAALRGLEFVVNDSFVFSPAAPGQTTFTVDVQDSVLNRATRTLTILLAEEPRNWLVTTTEDNLEPGSLRWVLQQVHTNRLSSAVITFAMPEYPALIRLTNGPLEISRNVTLLGPGADILEISGDLNGDGEPDVPIFRVDAHVTMECLALTHGGAIAGDHTAGGAVAVGPDGHLTIRSSLIKDSVATQWGGAIDVNGGSLLVEACLFQRNRTDTTLGLGGGAISIFSDRECFIRNSTFSANVQGAATGIGGGAIYAENATPSSQLTVEVVHCTFSENLDHSRFGGTAIHANVFGTEVGVRNSIFADGQGRNLEVQGAASLLSGGGNISDDQTRTVLTQDGQPRAVILLNGPGDRTNAVNVIHPLDETVRPVAGYPPVAFGPAIGRAVQPVLPTDQRGSFRFGPAESGALEFGQPQRIVLNEIDHDPVSPAPDFLEFYVPRDSLPVDLSGFTIRTGTNSFIFPANTRVAPGRGILVADTMFAAAGNPDPTPVLAMPAGQALNLGETGEVELLAPGGRVVLSVAYYGNFVDPHDPADDSRFDNTSLTLAPQFRGRALLPHGIVNPGTLGGARDLSDPALDPQADPNSPGSAITTPFGSPNAEPLAVADTFIVDEDRVSDLPVLANDIEDDGTDRLFIIDLGRAAGEGGTNSTTLSARDAQVSLQPGGTPLRGTHVRYNPVVSSSLQALPVGAEAVDTFHYSIIDIGASDILGYEGTADDAPVLVHSPGHRLATGEEILISGAATPSYNGTHEVTVVDDDHFEIPVEFVDSPVAAGSWVAAEPRSPTQLSEARVTLTVLGANDPPRPVADIIPSTEADEDTPIRIMAGPSLTGIATEFDTDALYPQTPSVVSVTLLGGSGTPDTDPDLDDNSSTLRVVGVVGQVHEIQGYSAADGGDSVSVQSVNHGLEEGEVILISGYGGFSRYNGFHAVKVVDADHFTIPVPFVDNAATKGIWAVLTDAGRLFTTTALGAEVRLEIRVDPLETSVVYNPLTSSALNALAVSEVQADDFYYAVSDRHGAVSLGRVTVSVAGVNDAPVPSADPSALALLDALADSGAGYSFAISNLVVAYYLPPSSGGAGRADVELVTTNTPPERFLIPDVFTTDEETPLDITGADLVANDMDVDTSDVLRILSADSTTARGAVVTLDGQTLRYDPRPSARIESLAREEPLLDFFEVVVTDDHSGNVPSFVMVLVTGVNDTPVAVNDTATTDEDSPITLHPLVNDTDADIDTFAPDNVLRLVPEVKPSPSPAQALVVIDGNSFLYDPTTSPFLNGLAVGQTHVDTIEYTAMDGSFLFANDDRYEVAADGTEYTLTLLDNDRNLTGVGEPIAGYSGSPGTGPVTVSAPAHGLSTGDSVAIEGYGGAGLYNRVHRVEVLDADTFTIPAAYVDNHAVKGAWSRLRIVEVTPPSQGGTVEIDPGGSTVSYSPAVSLVGEEVFAYTIEDSLGNVDRGVVSIRAVVEPLNGNLQVNRDFFSVARGQSAALDVLANDHRLPASGRELTLTRIVSQPVLLPGGTEPRDAVTISDNRVLFQQSFNGPATNLPYEVRFAYEASGGGTAAAVGEVVVRVVDRGGTLATRNDSFGVLAGSLNNMLDVLENDSILPGTLEVLTVAEILIPPAHGAAEISGDGTRISYTPDPGFVGEDTFRYGAADNLGGTGEAEVRVVVGALTTSSDFFAVAFDDPGRTDDDGATELDVLQNDRVLGAANVTLRITAVTPVNPSLGAMSIRPDGQRLVFDPAPDIEGEQTFTYTIQDQSNPPRSAQGQVVVVVARPSVRASSDFFVVSSGSTLNFLPVLTNDVVIPDRGRALTVIRAGTGLDGPDRGGTVTVSDARDGLIYTPAPGFVGQETFTYTMTDSRGTDTARVVVWVGSGALSANDDAFTVFMDTSEPREFTLRVLANDLILPDNGLALFITGVGVDDTNGTNAPGANGHVRISADGTTLLYVASNIAGPFPYTERFTYEISDGSPRRVEAVVLVHVEERSGVREPETNPDFFSVFAGSTGNRLAVLENDGALPSSAAGWSITGVSDPDFGGIATIDRGAIVYSPPAGFVGTETFTYSVSDGVGGTASAQVAVRVGDRILSRDVFTALSGSRSNILDVLANDAIRPEPPVDYVLAAAGPADRDGTVEVRDNTILYTPDPDYGGPYPYVETFPYIVEDDSGGTVTNMARVMVHEAGTDRDVATVAITVHGVNDPPTITNSGPATVSITDKETVAPFAGFTIGEVDNQGSETVEVRVVLDEPAAGRLTNLGGFAETTFGNGAYVFTGTAAAATTAIRGLVFTPTENYVTVPETWTFTFDVLVTDPHVTVPTATFVEVQVQAVNDPPVISGTLPDQPVYHLGSIKPFATVLITEVDDLTLQPLAVSFSYNPSRGAITHANGFTSQGAGTYAFEGTAAEATAALMGVVFSPDTGNRLNPTLSPPADSERTVFTLTVNDGFAPAVVDTNTSVVAYHGLIREALPNAGSAARAYGYAVAAARNHIAIGAPEEDGSGSDSGAVYVRARNAGGGSFWGQVARLVATDQVANARFGHAVAMSGERIVVGAPGARMGNGSGPTSGAVYVFEPSAPGATNWQANAVKIVPNDGANSDTFGHAVATSGDYIAVGSPQDDDNGGNSGAVYIFQRQGTGWVQVAKIVANSVAGDRFGHAVALSGNRLAVGAPNRDANGSDSGAAYIFTRNAPNQWVQTKFLLPVTAGGGNDGSGGDLFGSSVDLDDDHVIVGSPRDDDGGNDRGSAYIFRQDAGGANNWGRVAKILGGDALNNDQFGFSVALSENLALVGMPFSGESNQSRWGSAWVFHRHEGGTNNWGIVEELLPPDGGNNQEFGYSVALECGTTVIGARLDPSFAGGAGSAYIFELRHNKPPYVVVPLPDQFAIVGTPFSLVIPPETFGDADTDESLTLSATLANGNPLPGWLSLDSTGTLAGTPSAGDLGTLNLLITATDLCGDFASTPLLIGVVNSAPPMLPAPGAPLTYAQWIQRLLANRIRTNATLEASVWGPLADPDGDGFTNLEEYAFATRLFSESATDGPGLAIGMAPGGRVAVSFRRRTNDASLAFTLQFSADLQNWTDAASLPKEELIIPLGHSVELVTCLLPQAQLPPNIFFRVRIDTD